MPYNYIEIQGLSESQREQLTDLFEKEELFETLLPVPAELPYHVKTVDNPEEYRRANKGWSDDALRMYMTRDEADRLVQLYGFACGFHWCNFNWGDKWDTCEADVSNSEDGSLTVTYITDESPHHTGFMEISKLFPEAKFSHLFSAPAPGSGFCGAAKYANGAFIDVTKTYSEVFESWAAKNYPDVDLEANEDDASEVEVEFRDSLDDYLLGLLAGLDEPTLEAAEKHRTDRYKMLKPTRALARLASTAPA